MEKQFSVHYICILILVYFENLTVATTNEKIL